jgi:preprotein translocase subunit SecF
MEFFKPGKIHFSFVDQGKRRFFGTLSSLLVLGSIVLFAVKQMNGTVNWGIDFAGGTVIDVEFDKEVPIEKLRALVNSLGYKKSSIQRSQAGLYRARGAHRHSFG